MVDTTPGETPPAGSVWHSLEELQDPLVECYDALGVDAAEGWMYVLTIDREPWRARFVQPEHVFCEWTESGPLAGGARVPKEPREQLLSSVASVSANFAEGYSRPTGPDRARFFAYSLGSLREAIVWYSSLSDVLGERTLLDRVELLSRIRKLTLGMLKATHHALGSSAFKP